MRRFDSVYVVCRKCKSEVEFQTKAGDCAMMVYMASDKYIPFVIACDLDGQIRDCQSCGSTISIETRVAIHATTH